MKTLALIILAGFLTALLSLENPGTRYAVKTYAAEEPKEENTNPANNDPSASAHPPVAPVVAENRIQVALLLDASNSMDGLIEQAKSRLWNIVNTLTTLKFRGQTPEVQISLYMYGNDGLSEADNYIKQITPFTSSLDLISEKLFAVTTNGGSEYCGAVIADCVKHLEWGSGENDMKLVFIAGNEPFNQGGVNYKEAISEALGKNIFINTIHCGDCRVGERDLWKDGAIKGKGKYFCINSDERVDFVETPYDIQINICNEKLNKTYIYYGSQGASSYENQNRQDNNAESVSRANKVERSVSKSKAIYKNKEWDLVDMAAEDEESVKKVSKGTLPKEYQGLSEAELKVKVKEKATERTKIQKEIAELSVKRQQYIDTESKKKNSNDDLGKVISSSILELASDMGYKQE